MVLNITLIFYCLLNFLSTQDLKKLDRELQAKENELKKREQVFIFSFHIYDHFFLQMYTFLDTLKKCNGLSIMKP